MDVVMFGPADSMPVVTNDLERGRWAMKVIRNNLESSRLLGLGQRNRDPWYILDTAHQRRSVETSLTKQVALGVVRRRTAS